MERPNWRWIDKSLLVMLLDESLTTHGGAAGVRDKAMFEFVMKLAPNLLHYGKPDYAELAIAYGVGLEKNHAFVDGNKLVAFLSVGLFLMRNGYNLTATQVDATLIIFAVAIGEIDEAELAMWIHTNSARRA